LKIRTALFSASLATAALTVGATFPGSGEQAFAATKIEVVVNNDVITSYEVANRARLLRLIDRKLGGSATRVARQELVDDKLRLQEAKRLGIGVSKEQVDDAFGTIARRTKMSPSQLASILRRSGVDPEELKRRLLAQMAWRQVVRMRFQASVKIEEQDVIAALREKNGEEDVPKYETTEYNIYQIIFVVSRKAKRGTDAAQLRAAKQLQRSFSSCSADLEKARGMHEVVVKKIGIRTQADLNEENRKRLEDVEEGRLTDARKTEIGYEMLAVCEKRVLESNAAALSLMKDKLQEEEGERLSRRFINELRRNANVQYR